MEEEHDWRHIHDWEFPMYPPRFIEATCIKCHHQVESLISESVKDEAPKVVKGYNLVRELGCFGCHEISGVKAAGGSVRICVLNPIRRSMP